MKEQPSKTSSNVHYKFRSTKDLAHRKRCTTNWERSLCIGSRHRHCLWIRMVQSHWVRYVAHSDRLHSEDINFRNGGTESLVIFLIMSCCLLKNGTEKLFNRMSLVQKHTQTQFPVHPQSDLNCTRNIPQSL